MSGLLSAGDLASAAVHAFHVGGLSAYVDQKVAAAVDAVVGGAPGTLNKLGEIAAAVADDAESTTTVLLCDGSQTITGPLNKASGALSIQ